MPSIKPDISPGKKYSAEKVSGSFIVPCGNGAELLEFEEEILDEMAGFIELFIISALLFSV